MVYFELVELGEIEGGQTVPIHIFEILFDVAGIEREVCDDQFMEMNEGSFVDGLCRIFDTVNAAIFYLYSASPH